MAILKNRVWRTSQYQMLIRHAKSRYEDLSNGSDGDDTSHDIVKNVNVVARLCALMHREYPLL